jgi:SAM-dependent methyltransferase/DNA-binding PadR family transcriptional regulator
MISKKERALFRNNLFRHLDGIAVAPTAYALHQKGVTHYLLEHKQVSLAQLTDQFKANMGYLNVALRLLCSQGWLQRSVDSNNQQVLYRLTESSELAFSLFHLYEQVVYLIQYSEKFHARKFQLEPFLVLEKIFKSLQVRYQLPEVQNPLETQVQNQVLKHIEGLIVGPTVVHLGMTGMFHKYFMEAYFKAEEFHKDGAVFSRLLDIFVDFGWFMPQKDTYRFTEKGIFYAKRASAYGVTVSYIPTFRKLDELIFGNPLVLQNTTLRGPELHVDRAMNVWGSGGAHAGYFKVVDRIIIDLFNKPIAEQPKGILDMGCGNGAFLIHLYQVIAKQTLRGTMLDEHPLILVGVDYNQAALSITKKNLIQADIWAKVIWGDIGNPSLLAADLNELYGVDLADLLNVRTFLDHNRIWEDPQVELETLQSSSTGAYAFQGKLLNNKQVELSLLEHMLKWQPYVYKFGLLLIELHTVNPDLVAQNLGKTAATAYDATHGFSDQYIIEIDRFMHIMELAGLYPDPEHYKKFPNSEIATISINIFSGKPSSAKD